MKAALPTLLWLSLATCALATDEKPVARPTPQPRVRLTPTPPATTPAAAEPPLPASHPIIVMSKYVVRDSPVVERAPQPVEREAKKFSWLKGGPMWSGKLGSIPVDVGLWRPIELMPETAKFRPQQTRADFGIVRLKF